MCFLDEGLAYTEFCHQAIDPESDVVVYLEPDKKAPRATPTPEGMIEVPDLVRCISSNGYDNPFPV